MKFSAAFILLCTVAAVRAEVKCGVSKATRANQNGLFSVKPPNWRIYDGVPAKPQEFPWQISIKMPTSGDHNCGGTIISDQWLLTAAHCPDTPKIVLGATDFGHPDGKEVTIEVEKWIRHPLNPTDDPDTAFLAQYDIALVKMKTKLDFEGKHNYLAPICLATLDDDITSAKTQCTASGWGYKEDRTLPDKLQKVDIRVWTNAQCFPEMQKYQLEITERLVCAGGDGTKGICNGDSGGPLQCKRSDGTWAQVGVVSFGLSNRVTHDCIQSAPAGFVRVSFFRDWILETIAE